MERSLWNDGTKISSKLIKSQKKTNAKVFFSLLYVCLYMSAPSSLIKQNQNSLQSVNAAGSLSLSIFKITCLSKIKLKKMKKKLNDLSMASLWWAFFRCWRGMLENFYLLPSTIILPPSISQARRHYRFHFIQLFLYML